LEIKMARVPDLKDEELTDQQRKVHQEIAGPRGGVVRGPFAIWMRNPALADKANQFGNALRLEGKLDKRLFELAILVVARYWTAQYEWFAHEQAALQAGLDPETVATIQNGKEPVLAREDERIVYALATELCHAKTVSAPIYDWALAYFGLDLLIELTTTLGFYTMVAMVLNTFDAPVPGGVRPLP
jgi:4-carboxymuconolactone decarboxylase